MRGVPCGERPSSIPGAHAWVKGITANQLNNYFAMTVRRAIVNTNTTIQGIPIAAVDFIPRARGPWHDGEDPQPEE